MNIEFEVEQMRKMTVSQLKDKFREVFGEDTRSHNKVWMIRRIAWRMQANVYGGLSERAKQRAFELANDADIRLMAPKGHQLAKIATQPNVAAPKGQMSGTEITRQYKGRTLVVRVEEDGFVFEGQRFKSLSAVAKHITGSHCSGQAFFKTKGPK